MKLAPHIDGLRRECPRGKHFKRDHERCCQGRSWVLIPEGKQAGALDSALLHRYPEGFVLSRLDGHYSVYILQVSEEGIVGATAIEAKAAALCQALGVR